MNSPQAVLFTQFRATQELLQQRLTEAGHTVAVFHGGLTGCEGGRHQQFRGPARILIATESAAKGAICSSRTPLHFDLPWNPMRIEQRRRRLSRIGQTGTSRFSPGDRRHG